MSKIQLIFHVSQVEENIKQLQDFGMVDIECGSFNTDTPLGKEYIAILEAIETLNEYNNVSETSNDGIEDLPQTISVIEVVEKINQLNQEKNTLLKKNEELTSLYEITKAFGEVGTRDIQELQEYSIDVKIFKSEKKLSHNINDGNILVQEVGRSEKGIYIAVVSYKDADFKIPDSWHEFTFPTEQLPSEIQTEINNNNNQILTIEEQLQNHCRYLTTCKVRKTELENILMQRSVLDDANTFLENELIVVQGFIPKKDIKKIQAQSDEYAWGLVISQPDEEDEVPTLTKNFKFVKIIQPLFKLMDTVPGYKEFDISALFLLFITLFYSMIIGDAGYGAVMFIFTLFATFVALKNKNAGLVHGLLLWFSASTVVWGALTGNWFGNFAFAEIPFLKQFVMPEIASSNPNSKETIMLFCFRVGLLHLCLAHLWKAIRVITVSIFAVIHELANGLMLFGLFFVTLFLLLDPAKYPLPEFAVPAILIGFGLIVITCEQQKGRNFFIGILKGFASLFTLFLGGVGALADLISYIRLFAVGLASLAIAQAFNTMGASIMQSEAGPIASMVLFGAGVLVIALGHTLNLAMALLAVMVHGVRLNMLEFGMHLGMEWTGRRFTPFQKKIITLLEEK